MNILRIPVGLPIVGCNFLLSLLVMVTGSHNGVQQMITYQKEEKDLTGGTISQIETRDKFMCFGECAITPPCQGIIYDSNSHVCQMIRTIELCNAGLDRIWVKQKGALLDAVHVSHLGSCMTTEPVTMSSVLTLVGQNYDPVTYSFVVPHDGLFVNSLLASGNTFHLYLNGNKQTSIMRYNDVTINMNSKTNINEYHRYDELTIRPDTTCTTCQISWTLFGLGMAMLSQVAFVVGRTSSFGEFPDHVEFDAVVLDEDKGWNKVTNSYRVVTSGIYSLTLTTACLPGKENDFKLYINGNIYFYNYCDNINHVADTVTTNRHVMISLNTGDILHLKAVSYRGSSYFGAYSDPTLQTSFSGFLYDPFHGCPVAWSVTRSTSLAKTGSRVDPIDFGQILVDVGGAWTGSNQAICTKTGIYVIYINMEQKSTDKVEINLVKDGSLQVTLKVIDTTSYAGSSTSRMAVIQCQQGQRLWLQAESGSAFYADNLRPTSFAGFLLN